MRALLVVPVLLLAVGCSGSDDPTVTDPGPSASASPSAGPSATASPTPSGTPAPSATASPTGPARAVPAADGDVDGDGTQDTITPVAGSLRVTLSSTGQVVTTKVNAERPGVPELLGTADVDRDGRAEVFLRTAEGASTTFTTPYRFDGTALRELQLDGGPARLGIGGGVTHGDGFRCLPTGQLEVRQATSTDGTTFSVEARTYRVSGDQLQLVGTRSGNGKQGSTTVEASYTADCGSVSA